MLQRVYGLARTASARPVTAILAAALGFSALYALASLWLPFGWDHGFMASVGDVWARGGLPYRDAWEIKGPLAYAPFALATLLFGNVMYGIRIIELAILIPVLAVLQRTVGALTSVAVGVGAAIALYLWLASHGFFFSAQPEIWASAAIAAAVCPLLQPQPWRAPKALTLLVIGALISCAGLIKPNYLVFGAVPLASLAIAASLSLPRRAVLAIWLAVGAALPVVLVVGYFAARGGLGAMIEVVLLFNLGTYSGSSSPINLDSRQMVLGVGAFLAEGPVTVIAPFALLGLWARRRERPLFVPLASWLGLAFLGVLIQQKLYTYHWFLLYPPLVVCAALGLHALIEQTREAPLARILAATAAVAFAFHVAVPPARDVLRWARLAVGQFGDDYYDAYNRESYSATDMVRAARYIRERSDPDDGLFVWGRDATLRYLADRPSPSRFTYDLPMSLPGPFRESYRDELIRSLSASPPLYFVVGGPWEPRSKEDVLAGFPELQSFLASRYGFEASVGNLDLYRRIDPSEAGEAY